MTGHALVVVDMQNDFITGSLAVPDAESLVPDVIVRAREVEAAGGVVVATADWHSANHMSFMEQGGRWASHCVMGTAGASLVDGIVAAGMYVFRKGFAATDDTYSGFDGHTIMDSRLVTLDEYLRSKGVQSLEVVGLATDFCVQATAIDGARRAYSVTVPLGLTRPITWQSGVEALYKMQLNGVKFA